MNKVSCGFVLIALVCLAILGQAYSEETNIIEVPPSQSADGEKINTTIVDPQKYGLLIYPGAQGNITLIPAGGKEFLMGRYVSSESKEKVVEYYKSKLGKTWESFEAPFLDTPAINFSKVEQEKAERISYSIFSDGSSNSTIITISVAPYNMEEDKKLSQKNAEINSAQYFQQKEVNPQEFGIMIYPNAKGKLIYQQNGFDNSKIITGDYETPESMNSVIEFYKSKFGDNTMFYKSGNSFAFCVIRNGWVQGYSLAEGVHISIQARPESQSSEEEKKACVR